MGKMNKGVIALAMVGFAALAMGASSKALLVKIKAADGTRNLLSAVDASTDAATLTVSENVEGYSRLSAVVQYADADTDCTSITLSCFGSDDDGVTWGCYTARNVSAKTIACHTDTFTLSGGTETISAFYDIQGYSNFKCVHSNTGTCGSDTFTTQWNISANK